MFRRYDKTAWLTERLISGLTVRFGRLAAKRESRADGGVKMSKGSSEIVRA